MTDNACAKPTGRGSLPLSGLSAACDAAELALNRGRADLAADLLHRTIDAFGRELAKCDPVTAALLDFEAQLATATVTVRERELVHTGSRQ